MLTARHYVINSLHVVTGASVLVTSLVLVLRVHRSRIAARASEAADSPSIAPITSRAGARA